MSKDWRAVRVGATTRENIVRSQARSSARRAAMQKGVPFHLPSSDVLPELPLCCPICGVRMEPGGGSRNNSPSLDRILPTLGYTIQNVWWICHDCNRRKSDLDPARAYRLWDKVWDKIKERKLPLPKTRKRP